jgi:hypothetical protein
LHDECRILDVDVVPGRRREADRTIVRQPRKIGLQLEAQLFKTLGRNAHAIRIAALRPREDDQRESAK